MDFVETAQYNAHGISTSALPNPWRLYNHPNGDHYYYHAKFRLLTTDNICDATILGNILEAREEVVPSLDGVDLLPDDYELVIRNVTETFADIKIYSRSAGGAYTLTEGGELRTKEVQIFWTFVAEFPSHHPDLPPNTEAQFIQALKNAESAIAEFPFTSAQIDMIRSRYNSLKDAQREGQNTTAALAWLMGMVMPLDAVGERVDAQNLEAMMNGLHT